MSDRDDDRIAAAHEAIAERDRIAHRIDQANEDRDRLVAELRTLDRKAEAQRAIFGPVLRTIFQLVRLTDDKPATDPVSVIRLQREAVAEELRATDFYLAELRSRATAVADADLALEAALAEKEARVGLDPGPVASILAEIAARERATRIARREVAEAISAGYATTSALPSPRAPTDAAQLGSLRRALVTFQRECKDVLDAAPPVAVTPIACVSQLVARDIAWPDIAHADHVAAVAELVTSCIAALSERDAQLDRGLDRLVRERAAALDVP